MRKDFNTAEFYERKIAALDQELKALYKKRSTIAWIRFAVFIVVCIAVYFLWSVGLLMVIASIVCGIVAFLLAVSKDANNKAAIKNIETLMAINKDEMDYLHQNYHHKYNGKDLEPAQHPYAKDLDVFGQASLFQYINRCNAQQGIQLLAARLLQPLSKEKIMQQQQAVKTLNAKMDWLQQFGAYGILEKITFDAEKRINKWLEQEENFFDKKAWQLLLYIYPVITLGCFFLFLIDIISMPAFSLLLLIFFGIAFLISGKIQKTYTLLSQLVPVVSTFYKQLNWFEKEKFEDVFLISLQHPDSPGRTASASMRSLQKILERFDVRLNVFAFFILNTFLLWDLWQITALNKWKKNNKASATNWFDVIAEVEVAGSFAVLHFNNPGWNFPVIADAHFTLAGKDIGHPLISKQQCVNNDFALKGTAKVDLVTGSNMAGKSTFLRSLGVNMVLAYAGSCVCAEGFTVSIAQLMSSMRIEDNLAENTSTFYAELKKLKSIIDAVNKKERAFILLDEILRGTNSLDRHTGSKALIEQLIHHDAVAIIATHDIELSKLENDFPQSIKNYHFDVQVSGDKLFFDYKLKQGICRSMNASILMKQIGIEM
ncbi:MAG TPA: hypothetical protein VFW07_18090 [Parafilimonas sp.]|nr:hypothetical protein [Parafilimonas sp.]